jgi:CheY-like chemotaxis protein
MSDYRIQPFFFPTTVMFVDDSADFLANLSLQLDSHLAFRLFDSPFDALTELNKKNTAPPCTKDFFSLYRDRAENAPGYQVININLDLIHREVFNEERFKCVPVVVVDFDMPGMDGVDFCRCIQNRTIKKILLTGKADERIAVKAFNEGIIDRFILKQEVDVMSALNRAINEMQEAYFRDIGKMLSDALSVEAYIFLRDPLFAERFRQIRESLGIVEYYLCCKPDGILMLDAVGTPHLLIVQTEETVQTNYEIAYDQAAPEEMLTALRSGKMVPYFWKTEGYYSPLHVDWQPDFHPATECKGKTTYLFTVVKNPPPFHTKHVLSYAKYLDRLDLEGREAVSSTN